MGWHVISGEDLMVMLRRVEIGERPDLVYAEYWANAIHAHPHLEPGDPDEG
jgi:hypothetical protein